tara:strand:- start:59 stop:184 length:126 start_codon:yes stop_codon:yes gene_type:complete
MPTRVHFVDLKNPFRNLDLKFASSPHAALTATGFIVFLVFT